MIWTNAHVVAGLAVVLARFASLEPTAFAVRSGTRIGGDGTLALTRYVIHPGHDGTVLSPDVAVFYVGTAFASGLTFLSREQAQELRVGQSIATMGFPGEIQAFDTAVPIATFKDGAISALRPYNPVTTVIGPAHNKLVQHNLDLSGGTSGSPIFNKQGFVVAVNNSGTEKLVIDERTGAPSRIPSGNIGFGIRADAVWDFIESVPTAKVLAFSDPPPSLGPDHLRMHSLRRLGRLPPAVTKATPLPPSGARVVSWR